MQINFKSLTIAALFGITQLVATSAFAADPLAVAPEMYKLLFENEKVRVMQVTFDPGQSIPKHSHPDHFVFVNQPGKLQLTTEGGKPADVDLETGKVMWIPSETHSAKNIGKSKVQLLVTELKK